MIERKKQMPFISGICLICFIISLTAVSFAKERTFSIREEIRFKNLPKGKRNFSFWIPYPASDTYQAIKNFKIITSARIRFITDKRFGNKIIYIAGKHFDGNPIILSFAAERKECKFSADTINYHKFPSPFLKSDRLVPVNAQMKKLALDIVEGKTGELQRVRAIYDYIIDELTYSKDDPRICGIGNPLLTLKHKKGICTDYHSLFISLVRSLGIPAKFEIGFKIPHDRVQGELNGYHCWAKFYLKERGWIPVDISEADKHPEKKDYYFGAIDENKVHLTTGRDINLKYVKDAGLFNFFVYPYAELNGRRLNIEVKVLFEEEGGGA